MNGGKAGLSLLRLIFLSVLVWVLVYVPNAWAHESRPAYLEINETTPGRYSVLWRTPVLSGMRLPVALKFPDDVRNVTGPTVQELTDSLIERRVIDAGASGLAGKQIEFVGLQATITDVLVRMQMLDGTYSTTLVRPSKPWIEITPSHGLLVVAGAYLKHGIEHILFGYDHLLFIFALILIVRSRRVLLMTITAFTIAHSITLAVATLGAVHVPRPPVEAAIALSILLLACEIVRSGELDREVAMGSGLFFRPATRFRLCKRTHGHRTAAERCSARAIRLQRGGRTRAARIHRGGSQRPDTGKADQASFGHWAPRAADCNLCDWHTGGVLVLRALRRILDASTDMRDLYHFKKEIMQR